MRGEGRAGRGGEGERGRGEPLGAKEDWRDSYKLGFFSFFSFVRREPDSSSSSSSND